MISIKQVIAQIEAFATAHYQVKKFGFEFFEQMPNLATVDEKFPYMFVTPVGATTYENMVEFDLDVYCVDRLQKDRTNMKFTISDTQLILSDLSIWLEDGDHDIDVERIYPQTPINNALLDYVDGWVMKIKVQVDRVELCEVPMDGIIPPDVSCEDATYSITDTDGNVLYSGSISSGGSLDQSIQDSTVSITDDNGNVLHSVSVLAEGSATQAVADSTVTITDDSANTLYTLSVNAEGSVSQVISDSTVVIKDDSNNTLHTVSVNAQGSANQIIADSTVNINNSAATLLHSVSVNAQGVASQTIADSSVVNSDASYSASILAEGSLVLPDITVTDSDGSSSSFPSAKNVTCTPQIKTLYWELNFNDTDDVIFIPATVNNVGTLASGSGSNVGTITVSTDGVTYGALSFPFTPVAATTYYFKRSTSTVTGSYTMTGTYA
jgi:hypothetical protein